MIRELREGMYLLHETHSRPPLAERYAAERPDWYEPGAEIHSLQNAYVLKGDRTLLFDTNTPAGTEQVLDELETVLDGDDLDYLVVSHPEAPHAGNAFAILDRHPETTFVAPGVGDMHPLYHLEAAEKVFPGDRIDLGGFEVEFLDPAFPDHGLHMWMRELTTDALFTVDWIGFFCMDHERAKFVDELDAPVSHHRLLEFSGRVLFWLEYADSDRVARAIERLIDDYDPQLLLPAHGLPIRTDTHAYMRRMKTVSAHINAHGRLDVSL
ncbi:MBL fold metallo-hydrolase [Haloferacaceae archaeon DSL9]